MHNLRKFTTNIIKKQTKCFRPSHIQNITRCTSTIDNTPELVTKPQFTVPKGVFGQATFHTHPHLIKPPHLTCGITQMEYRERREKLVSKLVAEVDNMHKTHIYSQPLQHENEQPTQYFLLTIDTYHKITVPSKHALCFESHQLIQTTDYRKSIEEIVIPAACKQYISDKIPYVFRQNSDFFYLTGCLEPAAVLVMVKPAQTDSYKSILFVHDKDSHAELWEGPRTGCAAAAPLFAVDEARPVETFGNFLTKITSSSKPSVLWYHNESPVNPDVHGSVRSVLRPDGQVTLADPQRTLHFMRVIKSSAEIELMKETCHIGSQSVNMAMACTKPGVSEHSLNAVLEYTCRQAGAEHLAFPPVVAGGARATHIHYVTNNQLLAADEMVLVDSGSQRWLYNSDISRTWPVSGKFSKHHRILYELVLAVQKRLIEILGEHRPPLDQLFDSMCRLLGIHLQQEGILPKNIDGHELIGKAYRLCPHHVSHYLGMDVHDSPLVRRNVPVCSDMVVTVEPGIYIRPDDETVPEEFRGVGIRIEDDVLITDREPLILTESCVKEVRDIEAIVGKQAM